MPKKKNEEWKTFSVRIPTNFNKEIEDYRATQRDENGEIPPKLKIVEELLRAGLKAKQAEAS